MVQWLAHPTGKQGDAGSIPTHGIQMFFSQKESVSSSLSLLSSFKLINICVEKRCVSFGSY